jgi:hypothetical protein
MSQSNYLQNRETAPNQEYQDVRAKAKSLTLWCLLISHTSSRLPDSILLGNHFHHCSHVIPSGWAAGLIMALPLTVVACNVSEGPLEFHHSNHGEILEFKLGQKFRTGIRFCGSVPWRISSFKRQVITSLRLSCSGGTELREMISVEYDSRRPSVSVRMMSSSITATSAASS